MSDQDLPGAAQTETVDGSDAPLRDAPDHVLRALTSGTRLVSLGIALTFLLGFVGFFLVAATYAIAPSLETNPVGSAIVGGALGVMASIALSVGHVGWLRIVNAERPAPFDLALRSFVKRTVQGTGVLLLVLPFWFALRQHNEVFEGQDKPIPRWAAIATLVFVAIMMLNNFLYLARYFAGTRLLSRICARFGDDKGRRGSIRLIRVSSVVATMYFFAVGALIVVMSINPDSPAVGVVFAAIVLLSFAALFLLIWYARALRRVRQNAESFLRVRQYAQRGGA